MVLSLVLIGTADNENPASGGHTTSTNQAEGGGGEEKKQNTSKKGEKTRTEKQVFKKWKEKKIFADRFW